MKASIEAGAAEALDAGRPTIAAWHVGARAIIMAAPAIGKKYGNGGRRPAVTGGMCRA